MDSTELSEDLRTRQPLRSPVGVVVTTHRLGRKPQLRLFRQLEPDASQEVVVPLESFVPGELAFRRVQAEKGHVKLSAAWLIEHSGVTRGFSLPGSGAAVSSKHTLALVNRGSATASDIAELARYVQSRVLNAYGVILQPEPILVGVSL